MVKVRMGVILPARGALQERLLLDVPRETFGEKPKVSQTSCFTGLPRDAQLVTASAGCLAVPVAGIVGTPLEQWHHPATRPGYLRRARAAQPSSANRG